MPRVLLQRWALFLPLPFQPQVHPVLFQLGLKSHLTNMTDKAEN
jgi:hypothetical protein